ncbi:hypothetical protein ACVIWU_001009 [Bradyrhizobium sp. USDA 4509]
MPSALSPVSTGETVFHEPPDGTRPKTADAAKLAAHCQAVDDRSKGIDKHVEAATTLWIRLGRSPYQPERI